ncbi:GrlR family regulatory protein [Salmonella enterica]|uniref:GrlR family regulatory protein n=1 Tax=Salmonella enterica TaxID=28901 RepID=UPI000F98C8F3|nr:nucleoside transporter [Salmonella enterica]EBE2443111.1 nucleoside transporter [Salmonella enterica subsp. enterica serovar Infantis]EBQ9782925.1 nucleoside transporter [Salmonella enterica subsp. enterica serovar Inganda]EBU7310295.1 nucleoside transporter [Salmonella enterica subsp. enterica serovar Panama]ECC1244738.1 nucleoside transporter [Salmonella enterica subsp. enterica serovar Poona]ECH8971146.1 nucleoside transporter [Salmonella enterica subsp. enterica]EHN6577948.1 nucleoside
MKEGIYTVVFESSLQAVGEGTVVVSDGKIHGGDIAFTCRGRVTLPVMELEVRHYNAEIPSALGMDGDYVLEMRYRETGGDEYHFTGHVKGEPGRRLSARARWLSPLLS